MSQASSGGPASTASIMALFTDDAHQKFDSALSLPLTSLPYDDPFELLTAVAGPLPLSPTVGAKQASSPLRASLSSSPLAKPSLLASQSLPLQSSSSFNLSPLHLRHDSLDHSDSHGHSHHSHGHTSITQSPVSVSKSIDLSSLSLFDASTPSSVSTSMFDASEFQSLFHNHSLSYSNASTPHNHSTHLSMSSPVESEIVSFFSPIFWSPAQTHAHQSQLQAQSQPGKPPKHIRSASISQSIAPTVPPSQSSSPTLPRRLVRPVSHSRSPSLSLFGEPLSEDACVDDSNPFLFTPTTTSLPHPPPDNTPPLTESPDTKRSRLRAKTVNEILTSETTYVDALNTLFEVYINPLKSLAKDSEKRIISEEQVLTLSSNLQAIASLNAQFLQSLNSRVEQWDDRQTCLGDLFLTFGPFLKLYTQYVGNHDTAVQLIQSLDNNHRWREFLAEAIKQPCIKNLPLQSFLITPIQRIPRYKLLLAELLKHTDASHPDYNHLEKSLSLVSGVAAHINDFVRANENRAKIREIQSLLMYTNTSLISPSRRFIRQSLLTKQCRSNATRTYLFLLFNDLLLYASKVVVANKWKVHKEILIDESFNVDDIPNHASDEESKENQPPSKADTSTGAAEYKESGNTSASTSAASPTQYRWKIINSAKSLVVMTSDPMLKQAWVSDLLAVMEERKKTIKSPSPLLTASKSAQFSDLIVTPVFTDSDSAVNGCQLCQKKFSLTQRKFTCRLCGATACNECTQKKLVLRADSDAVRVCSNCYDRNKSLHSAAAQRGKSLALSKPGRSVTGKGAELERKEHS